jgi:hypothetical protein
MNLQERTLEMKALKIHLIRVASLKGMTRLVRVGTNNIPNLVDTEV